MQEGQDSLLIFSLSPHTGHTLVFVIFICVSPHVSIISFYFDFVNIRIKYYKNLYYLDFQYALHDLACSFFVLIEGVCIDIQRGRRLTVTEQSSNCANVRAAGDEQACRRVAQAVNIQVRWQVIRLEDFLKRHVKIEGVIGSSMPFLRNT